MLYISGDPEYTDVLARRENDNLTLTCKLRGESAPSRYVWNYIPADENSVPNPYTVKTEGGESTLIKSNLSVSDSGQYLCSAPPFSASKYIVVQTKGPMQCARGAFWCGKRCVLATYVCDGFTDCEHGEDEHVRLCNMHNICQRSDKLNCSGGRCISESACCGARMSSAASPLCRQPACCDEFAHLSTHDGFVEFDHPPLQFEDRHAPDDYGFIQSTIYTVTACALIFMIAVVLLVSAICKMHMKRAALRSYAHAHRATAHHYNAHYAQAQRFPPCYEASRLLEQEGLNGNSPSHSPQETPTRQNLQCNSECPPTVTSQTAETRPTGMGLARLSAIFSSRYRQVPTQPPDVEMTLRSASLTSSPTRQVQNYRSPTYCDINTEYLLNSPDSIDCARNLNVNYELPRRNTLERVIDHIDRQRLTLQLGRFQLTLPNLPNLTGFRRNSDRPDTPNVTEVDLQDLDFVRLGSNDTYTLNGRTIRLLGGHFENYPLVGGSRPPPYTEAMRYKLYGPPPEYLSREGLNGESQVDQEARTNVEMPPGYDEVNGNVVTGASGAVQNNSAQNNPVVDTVTCNNTDISARPNVEAVSNILGNSDCLLNTSLNAGSAVSNNTILSNEATDNSNITVVNNETSIAGLVCGSKDANSTSMNATVPSNGYDNGLPRPDISFNNNNLKDSTAPLNFESLNSVIDNLPAIDSDINAN